MDADITSQAVGLASNTDFSILSLFLRADFVVKSVIIILIASSIYSWAIIFDKIVMFRRINKDSEDFEDRFWKSKSAETFYNSLPASLDNPMAQLFKDSMQAVMKSRSKTNISQRLENILEVNIEKQMNVVNNKFTFLATVGSTAPFIGLFGTVWGIMIPQTVPNNPINGAVDPTVARKVNLLFTTFICFSIFTSNIFSSLWLILVLDLDFITACIESLNN